MLRYSTTLCLAVVLTALPSSSATAKLKRVSSEVDVAGRIADMTQTIQTAGQPFRVGLTGLSYRGRVDRALLEQNDSKNLTIWLALRDIVLTINRTSISGRPGRATCGPLSIRLGHRRDLWIAFDFRMAGEAAQSTLKLVKTRFALPTNNWSVGSPAWVKTSGFGMSRSKVVKGLRSGLISNKSRIEQRLIDIAPTLLATVVPVANNTAVDRYSIAAAVHRKLVAGGYLSMKREPAVDVAAARG